MVPYTARMRSVANELKAATWSSLQRLSPFERIELALRLGESDCELFMATSGLDAAAAERVLRGRRRVGRRASTCAAELDP